ncbi:MAG: hypothetical protein IIC60_12600 [Proteobacteria bacterium]|nr:hypothetical protein [Pseudomonadota bacterium]
MSQFEYLSVLISILIGLGITQMTISWGQLLQHPDQVRFSWLHGFWSVFILFIMIQFWWAFWSYRTVTDWSLAWLFIKVLQGISLVFCTILILPGRVSAEVIDLDALYYANARAFFLFAMAFLVLSSVGDTLILGMPLVHTENVIRVAGLGLLSLVAWSTDRRLHVGVPIVSVVLLAVFLARAYMP